MPKKEAAQFEPTIRQPAPDLGPRARRTIEAILDATREIFLTKGYGGTAIDDITKAAGVSRASFYTYFPTKRDAMLALGSGATTAAREAITALDLLPQKWAITDLEQWLRDSMTFLDVYGSFGFAWGQAAYQDEELRQAGMRTHLRTCELLGEKLNGLRSAPVADDTELGLLIFSMLERTWSHQKLYEPTLPLEDVVRSGALLLEQILSE